MKRTDCIEPLQGPHFYMQLGQLVASTGDEDFAGHMLQLLNELVPIDRLDLSEWVLDPRQTRIARIKVLGCAGPSDTFPSPENLRHPLLQSVMQMRDPLLIQLKTPPGNRRAGDGANQCNLVSRSGNRRRVISCYRQHGKRAFSLSELAFLKRLSDTLLPLVEQHAQLDPDNIGRAAPLLDAVAPGPIRQVFQDRLAREDVRLSLREQEVCVGLLSGGTVPEMAQRLDVKVSSVETYLKRATAKLGVSGRHGLAKWMASV
ncbi:MAG TPA: helix-turn-helix transcriptional regulator [Pseudomonas sp.]|uniref:helix-turn-helix transcriptional regulator n=1 Tax=Pseudomonas sp. TaxID=306 RepID=UPI002B472608|nr:helix-turn-helix transcriptional regulator [Pseudomonas sp.]HKS12813.1 helix-turn-helix transcriptional regulator [Pseudomonas sp.]